MATYCGQNVGACKLDRLSKGIRSCALLGLGYSLIAFCAMLRFAPQCALLFLDPKELDVALLTELTTRYILVGAAFFFPLSLVNIVRFSIQGMGFSPFAILAGVLEMAARTVVGIWLVPVFGYTAACFASPAAWVCADLFLIPASALCIGKLRRLYPNQPEELSETRPVPLHAGAQR
jgi:Na+-driven multidrug efflux pump